MTDTNSLIEAFLAKGGQITRCPSDTTHKGGFIKGETQKAERRRLKLTKFAKKYGRRK